jgi:hypothetical protein
MDATQILKTRVTPETKARVVEIALGELLTEAVWLRRHAQIPIMLHRFAVK